MNKATKVAAAALGMLAAAQLVRPARTNPPIDPSRTIAASLGTTGGLVPVLDRSCGQCHSNATVWPWYTSVAPTSWLMAAGVKRGREAVNFSEWGAYAPERQRALLVKSCEAVTSGKMPGIYTMFDNRARLTPQDVDTICAASRQGGR